MNSLQNTHGKSCQYPIKVKPASLQSMPTIVNVSNFCLWKSWKHFLRSSLCQHGSSVLDLCFPVSPSLSAWGSSNHKSSVRISESLFHKPSETVVFRSYHCSVTAWHSNVSDLYIVHVVKYTACHRRELQWLYVTALKIWSSGIEFFYLCQRAPIQVSTGSGLFSTSLGLRPGKCQYEHCTVLYLLKSCNSLEHFWELHCIAPPVTMVMRVMCSDRILRHWRNLIYYSLPSCVARMWRALRRRRNLRWNPDFQVFVANLLTQPESTGEQGPFTHHHHHPWHQRYTRHNSKCNLARM